jgi:hypothetical protein
VKGDDSQAAEGDCVAPADSLPLSLFALPQSLDFQKIEWQA